MIKVGIIFSNCKADYDGNELSKILSGRILVDTYMMATYQMTEVIISVIMLFTLKTLWLIGSQQ